MTRRCFWDRMCALCAVCLLLFPLLFSGCARKPSDSDLIAVGKDLLTASQIVNHILFEEEIPAREHGLTQNGYYQADPSFLRPFEMETLEDVLSYARTVYSQACYEDLLRVGVDAQFSGSALTLPAYLYDGDAGLMVSEKGRHRKTDRTEFDFTTLTVLSSTATSARLSVKATVISDDGQKQTRQKNITLISENGTWVLDTLTCMTYIEESY